MKVKAGILTLHQADNYGAVLQAYALQQVLTGLGAQSELITTDFPELSLRTAKNLPSGAASRTAAVLKRRVQQAQEERSRLFSRFRQNYLHCSEIYLRSELAIANRDYDVFIAGSDQVWNLRLFGAHESYFLTFADSRKKTSYAASFGSTELSSKARKWCAEMLGDFALLSVRERSAQKLVEEMTGRIARVCLDPVLLLSRSKWDSLILSSAGLSEPTVPQNMKNLLTSTAPSNPSALSDMASSSDKKLPSNPAALAEEVPPYYLLYLLQYDQSLADRARKTAREAGAGLKVVTGTFMPQFGFQAYNRTGVLEWIRLIAHAEGIFTDSFHGTVFALLYDKPFLTSLPAETGKNEGRSCRIAELLRSIGLSAEQGGGLTSFPPGLAWKRLDSARESSLQYLREIITYALAVKSG